MAILQVQTNLNKNSTNYDNVHCAKMDSDHRKMIGNLLHLTKHVTVRLAVSVNRSSNFQINKWFSALWTVSNACAVFLQTGMLALFFSSGPDVAA